MDQGRDVEKLGRSLLQVGIGAARDSTGAHACKIIADGQFHHLPRSQVDEFLGDAHADMILNVRSRTLFIAGNPESQEHVLAWATIMPLRVGMARPGTAFGNRSVIRQFSNIKLTQRSLSRQIANITKVIQDGGTNGPYVYRVRVDRSESDTDWGYEFDPRYRYIVIEM